jgi:peptide/nickel transport system ATP-binding protein
MNPLLSVADLTVTFSQGRRVPPLRAVDGVSLDVAAGETVGLVGESGSGKSTLGRAILGLVRADSGKIRFDGEDITHATRRRRRELSARLQVVFQDPYSSLNPARTVGQTLEEPLLVHQRTRHAGARDQVAAMLERVGLSADAADRYPGRFSGGQRQRIAIARALMSSPELVICDEPVSALDLSVQAQIMNLLAELQRELSVGYLFVGHDLAVVRHASHRIVVLYRGQVMEAGPAAQVHDHPAHPYTRALLDAAPLPDPEAQRARRTARTVNATGQSASEQGCPFAHRCRHVTDLCRVERPLLEPAAGEAVVACHHHSDLRTPAR